MANQKTASKPQPTTVEESERVIAALEDQRKALVVERQEQDDELKRVAFLTHAHGDVEARKRLAELREAAIRRDQKFKELEAASAAAQERLAAARAAQAREQDRAAAEVLRRVTAEISEAMVYADKHLDLAIKALNAVNTGLEEIHASGSAFPTHIQFKVNVEMALKTAIMRLPAVWWRDWLDGLVAPNDRRTFADFWSRMAVPLETGVKRRLGEQPAQKQKENAA